MSRLLADHRVLVVEDEMLIVMMVEDMLGDLGCKSLVTAGSVAQALTEIEAHDFDIAMLDSNLNGVSIDPVAETLASRGVPFFFATGQHNSEMSRGFPNSPVLKKPFSLESLEATFKQVLSAKK